MEITPEILEKEIERARTLKCKMESNYLEYINQLGHMLAFPGRYEP